MRYLRAAAVLVAVLAVLAALLAAIFVFTPGEWAVGAQIAGGTTALLVGVGGSLGFLVRKQQRSEELPWEIRLRLRTFQLSVQTAGGVLEYPTGKPITPEIEFELLMGDVDSWYGDAEHVKGIPLFAEARELEALISEYTFWRRIFWPWREPAMF